MVVSPAASAALAQDVLLTGLHDFGDDFVGLRILDGDAEGHFQDDVRPVLSPAEGRSARIAVLGPHDFPVTQVDECPELRVRPEDDVSATSAVTAVRAALGYIFRPVQMHGSGSAVSARTEDFHIVYEIRFGHDDPLSCKDTVFFGKGRRIKK